MILDTSLAWYTVLPFVAILLCIAVLPLIPATEQWWDSNRNKLLISLLLGIPVSIFMVVMDQEMTGVWLALLEYGQFIMLLLALFTVSGGIHLAGDIRARPGVNTAFLAFGAFIASFIGTTGAAMLLIRPILRTNSDRRFKMHTVIFFIFTVANSGGLLTPLGDPPLFLGMLRGVPFTWTLHLVPEWFFVNALLLIIYFAVDKNMYARENVEDLTAERPLGEPLSVRGGRHIIFLAMIVLCVALVPSTSEEAIITGSATFVEWVPWRELGMLAAMILSLLPRKDKVRYVDNAFTWGPIIEVAALFIGIFLTMIPALRVLGQVAPKLPLNEVTFFIFTGGLSGVLDNAPTYATFFEMAHTLGGNFPPDQLVAGVPEGYLVAISLGAVFCGTLTYIGNGPNFMVKAVAEEDNVEMPSFGGYIIWALRYMGPVLVAMVAIFLAHTPWIRIAGIALTAVLLIAAIIQIRKGTKLAAERFGSAV